jgi:hypothetical protein
MTLTTLAAVKRACQLGARLEIVATEIQHLKQTQTVPAREIVAVQQRAIAVRGCHRRDGNYDPDVLSWLYWPPAKQIEFHGDDTFTITGLARYRILPATDEQSGARALAA